jgi:nicotinamidase/pyrazinamidase
MKALILVDIQNDFLRGAALAVPDGDAVISVANQLQSLFPLVVATQDWHPTNHGSFAANHLGKKVFEQTDLNGLPQTLWPVHCVQGTPGAELAPDLNRDALQRFSKRELMRALIATAACSTTAIAKARGWASGLRAQASQRFLCAAWQRITALNSLPWMRRRPDSKHI